MIRQLLCFCLFLAALYELRAQDPVYSQFYAAPAQLNPAFTGSAFAPRVAFNYRNQWPGLDAYVTYSASYDQFIPGLNSGFGLILTGDDQGQGLIKTNMVRALYSYRVQARDDLFIKFGVEAGFNQSNYDWDRFIFLDQLDRINGPFDPGGGLNPTAEQRPESTVTTLFDVGAGLLIYTPKFYGGITLRHLTQPDDGLLRINPQITEGLPMLLSVHLGTEITLREGNKGRPGSFISPNLLLIRQANFGQINAGAYGGLGAFFAGAWYRHAWSNPDALILMGGVRYGVLKIGYSYDLTLSRLASAPSGGSHEISVILNFEYSDAYRQKLRNNRYNDCFQLFR